MQPTVAQPQSQLDYANPPSNSTIFRLTPPSLCGGCLRYFGPPLRRQLVPPRRIALFAERLGGLVLPVVSDRLWSMEDICCWCPLDQPCHADVLLELANG